MRAPFVVLFGLALLGGARLVHGAVERPRSTEPPWAPSPSAAPMVALGYREAAADWYWVRLRAYTVSVEDTAAGGRALLDAVLALDPDYQKAYEFASVTVSWVDGGPSRDDLLWVADVLERGITRFPDDWKLYLLAGETYLLDLAPIAQNDDERGTWTQRGTTLLEHATHFRGAPRDIATLVAYEQTKLGEKERAAQSLLELIRTTDDRKTRQRLIDKYSQIVGADADRIQEEEDWQLERVLARWRIALAEAPVEIYILTGDPPKPYIDFGDLVQPPSRDQDDNAAMAEQIGAPDEPADH